MMKRLMRLLPLLLLLCALTISTAAAETSWYDSEDELTAGVQAQSDRDAATSDDTESVFSDVSANDWFYDYVNTLYRSNVVGGFGDGTFRPQRNVTTGQALKMILLAAGYDEPTAVASHWARGYLNLALEQKILDTGEITDLDVAISRGLVAKVAARALGLRRTDEADFFTDTKDDNVHALYEYGIIGGYTDGTYRPQKSLSRAELSAIVCRIQDFLGYTGPSSSDEEDSSSNIPANFTLRTSETCITYLKEAEGFSATAYWDYSQYSIGYGSRCTLHEYPNGITKDAADTLLRKHLYEFEQELDAFLKKNSITLKTQEYDALIAFTYNTGSDWMRSSRLATLLKDGDYSENEFASAMGIWCHVGSSDPKISDGLIARRMREVNIFLYGEYGKKGETFCTVYFMAEDGSPDVDVAFYLKNSGYDPQFEATRSGDAFAYWQTENGDTLEGGDTITGDMTVWAVWESEL